MIFDVSVCCVCIDIRVNKVKANPQGKARLWYLPVDQTVHPLIDYRTKLPR